MLGPPVATIKDMEIYLNRPQRKDRITIPEDIINEGQRLSENKGLGRCMLCIYP